MTERIKNLHDELRNTLHREEPPAGFAERVLNRVAEQPVAGRSTPGPFGSGVTGRSEGLFIGGSKGRADAVARGEARFKLPFIQWAAAAALVAAVAGGFEYIAKQEQRAEGEAARERVVLALHIAGSKLQLVQTKINRLHEQPEKNSNQ
jgi:hypothetical protein